MLRIFATIIAVQVAATAAIAQDYPNRPITMIVSTTPGASPDLIARIFAQQLSEGLKQPVVVENKGGANGQIAVTALTAAAPDGYTFLATTGATLSVNPTLYPKTADVVLNQLAPVTKFALQDFIVTVRPSLGVRSLPELTAWSRQNPNKLNVSTTALGSLAYLTAQLFRQATGLAFETIPHNGGGLALGAVLGSHADVLVETISLSKPHIESGKLVPIAVTGARRSAFLPNVPTLKELGVDVETSGWTAMVAPLNTPPAIVARVQAEMAKGLDNPVLKKKLEDLSAEPVLDTPANFGRAWKQEAAMWDGAIKKANIKLQ